MAKSQTGDQQSVDARFSLTFSVPSAVMATGGRTPGPMMARRWQLYIMAFIIISLVSATGAPHGVCIPEP